MSDELDDLSTVDWLQVPDTSFIVKCKFSDVGYSVMMSDLTRLYGEQIRESEVQERFCKLNPYAEMKTSVIIKNVKETLEEGLRVKTSTLTLHQLPEKLVLRLEFKAAQVSFIYDLELGLLSADQLRDNILVPTILNALLNHQKYLELKKKYEALENGQLLTTSMNKAADNHGNILPDLVSKKNIHVKALMEAFLKIQNSNKEFSLQINKLKRKESVESSTSPSKHSASVSPKKIATKANDSSLSIKYEDNKDVNEKKCETKPELPQQPFEMKVKKKKLFKL